MSARGRTGRASLPVPVSEGEGGFDFLFDVVGEGSEEVETGYLLHFVDSGGVVLHIAGTFHMGIDEGYSARFVKIRGEKHLEESARHPDFRLFDICVVFRMYLLGLL